MPENYFLNYLPLLIHFLFACGFAVAVVTLSWIIGVRKPTRAKISQIRTLSVERIGKRLGRIPSSDVTKVIEGLNEILGE